MALKTTDRGPVGRNLKRLRERKGLTQEVLAAMAGMKLSAFNAIERGRYKGHECRTLLRLAKPLECSLDDLLSGFDVDYDRQRARQDIGDTPMIETEVELLCCFRLLPPEVQADILGYCKYREGRPREGEASSARPPFQDSERRSGTDRRVG